MYYESLWNHVVIQQGIFIRLEITSYIASLMNNSKNSWSIWFSWFAIFRKEMQKLICKLPKCFANCELRTANSNPGLFTKIKVGFCDKLSRIYSTQGKPVKSGKKLENLVNQGKLCKLRKISWKIIALRESSEKISKLLLNLLRL